MSANTNSTSLLERISASKASELIPVDIYIGLMALVGLTGNALVIMFYSGKQTTSPTSRLIYVVAVVDAFVCFSMPKNIAVLLYPYKFTNTYLCKLNVFANHVTASLSGLLLLIIAVFRHHGVCKPFAPAYTIRHANICIGLACVFSLVQSTPTLFLYEVLSVNVSLPDSNDTAEGHVCQYTRDVSMATFWLVTNVAYGLVFVACFFSFVILYWKIAVSISEFKRNREFLSGKSKKVAIAVVGCVNKDVNPALPDHAIQRDLKKACNHLPARRTLSESVIKTTPMLVVITVINVLTYLPYVIFSIQTSMNKENSNDISVLGQVYAKTYLLSSSTNHFVYLIFLKSFRQFVKKKMCCSCCRKQGA